MAGFLSFGPVRGGSAQDLSSLTTSQLQQQAQQAVERQQFGDAVPALAELDRRLRESTDPASVQAREGVLYFLGVGRLHAGDYAGAAESLRDYVERYATARNAPYARLSLGDALYMQSQFPAARAAYDALRSDADALARLDALQQLTLWDRLSDCCFAAQDWAEGPLVFRGLQLAAGRLLDPLQAAEKRAKAGAYLLQAAIARDELEAALAALAALSGSANSARFDLSLNLALVRGGDAWYERGHYGEALHFYEQVLQLPELQRHWDEVIERTEREIAQVEGVTGFVGRRAELEHTLAVARQRRDQLTQAFADGVGDATPAVFFRIARCYLAVGRTFEAYWAFERLQRVAGEAEGAWTEEALYGLVVSSAANAQPDRLRAAAREYLAGADRVRFLGEVVHELVQSEQALGRAAELEPLWRELVKRIEAQPELRAAPRVVFVLGSSLLAQENFALLQSLLEPLKQRKPDAPFSDGVHYWLGLTSVFTGAFAAALEDFDAALREQPAGAYAEDAAFRRGVCQFGLLRYSEAQQVLAQFIANHPRSRLLGEAHALLGDLAAADGRVDDAMKAYRAAEEAGAQLDPPHLNYINHAIFQGGRLLTANGRWAEAAAWFETYIERWGKEGRLSDALYELGKARDALGQREEAVDGWFQAILRFGNDPADNGPDAMLAEYPEKHHSVHGAWPVELFHEALHGALARSEPTLALRLAYALRAMGEDDPAWPRVSASEDFELASAAVLVRVAQLVKETDATLALAATEGAIGRMSAGTALEAAWHLCGGLKAEAGDSDGALAAYRRAAELFPASRRAAVARLREGDLLRQAGQFEAAIAAYRTVLQTRQWRGAAWAEANFKIGLAHLEAGEPKEAFGFSQRVYVLYGSVVEWAAPAYVQSAIALEKLGRPEDARATYRELLAHEALRETPAAREAVARLAALP